MASRKVWNNKNISAEDFWLRTLQQSTHTFSGEGYQGEGGPEAGGRTNLSIDNKEGRAAEHCGTLVWDHPEDTGPQQQHEGEPAVVGDAPCLSHTQ